jgi:hypothetical protein
MARYRFPSANSQSTCYMQTNQDDKSLHGWRRYDTCDYAVDKSACNKPSHFAQQNALWPGSGHGVNGVTGIGRNLLVYLSDDDVNLIRE